MVTGLVIPWGDYLARRPDYWAGGTLGDYQGTNYRADDILGD